MSVRADTYLGTLMLSLLLKRFFPVLAAATLTGCPYTQGCGGPEQNEPSTETSPDDPANPGDDGSSDPADFVGSVGQNGRSGPAGVIDFGAEPTGGPALLNLSCPELTMPRSAATLWVDVNATGAQLGTKAAPFHSIAKAFERAVSKAVVYVAAGTYKENLVVPNKNLVVFGGFDPSFAKRTNACATVLEAASSSKPVLSAVDVKSFGLEGVTVQKGARGLFATAEATALAKITIARSVFTQNGQSGAVGGGALLDGVHARVFRSVFRENKASRGAALAGGGEVALTIDQNLFEKNTGHSDHGGGLYLNAKSSRVVRNTFRGNVTGADTAGSWGGAVIVYNNSASQTARADFAYNVFTENLAGIGAAVFVDEGATVTMSHDLVYRNRAYPENGFVRGAAIYVDGTGYPGGGSTFSAEYLTVVNNVYDANGTARSTSFGGGVYVEGFSKATIKSSIFWNNGENALYIAAPGNEIGIESSIGPTQCTSTDGKNFVPASAALCKVGAGVFQPSTVGFTDEAKDDYRMTTTDDLGAFARTDPKWP